METRLTLFIGLVFVVLAWNTMLIWVLARVLRRLAVRTARYQHLSADAIGALGARIEQAGSASAHMVGWSRQARERVGGVNRDFGRAANWIHYGLARIDFNVERASEELDAATKKVSARVAEPLYRTATVIQGVKALLELITLRQRSGDDGPKSAA